MRNPLPIGRYVTVRAKRRPNGRVDLYAIGGRKRNSDPPNFGDKEWYSDWRSDLGYKLAGQTGWNSREEAWRFAKDEIKRAGHKADKEAKKAFMRGWKARRPGR